MFALGIFVSPLPYAVVVAFYAVYMLLVHVNGSHEKQEMLASEAHKHIHFEDDNSASKHPGTFFVADSQFNNSKIFPSFDGLFTSFGDTAIDTSQFLRRLVIQEHFCQVLIEEQIAARPPPVV